MPDQIQLLKKVLNQAPCGIVLYNAEENEAIFMNRFFYTLTGYSEQEFNIYCKDPIGSLIYKEDIDTVKDIFSGDRNLKTVEFRIINKDGHIVWIKLSVCAVEIAGKQYYFGSLTDISREKNVESNLSLVSSQLGCSVSVIRICRNQYSLEYANEAFFDMIGCTREEFDADPQQAVLHSIKEDDKDYLDELVRESAEQNTPGTSEYPRFNSDGTARWLSRRYISIPQTEPDNYLFLSITTDITSQHNAEVMLHDVINYVPAGIMVFKLTGSSVSIQEANPAVCRMMGIDHGRTVGLTGAEVYSYTHPDDVKLGKWAEETLACGDEDIQYEYRNLNKKTGKYDWLSVTGHSIRQLDGSVLAYMCYMDITETKRINEVKTDLEVAKKTNEAKSDFPYPCSAGLPIPRFFI